MLAIKTRALPAAKNPGWVRSLENEILAALPHVEPLRTAAERQAAFDRRGDFVLAMPAGFARDQTARSRGAGHPA